MVTTYVVVITGDAFVFGEFGADKPVAGLQEKEFGPIGDASRLIVPPAQIVPVSGVTFRIGVGLTVIVRVAVLVQPAADVPVTVKVVVVVGETVIVVPVNEPGIQV